MGRKESVVRREDLERLHIFQSVDIGTVEPVLCKCPVRTLSEGEVLITAGEPNRYLYLLLAGRLSVHLKSPVSEPIITLEAGESVGEISLVDHKPTSAFVVTQAPSRVLVVDEEIMWMLVDASDLVSRNLLSTLAKRLRYDNELNYEDRKQLREQVQALTRDREALGQSEARFKSFAETAADWYWETDSGLRFTYLSECCEDAMGLSPEQILGRTGEELFAESVGDPEKWARHVKDLKAHRPFEDFEYVWVRPDGTTRVLRISGNPVFDTNDVFQGYRGAVRDVTEAHRMAQRIAHQASHDALTGLVNRREFEQRLRRVLETARTEGVEHALCYLDLDQFKVINDTCGHVAGDELLRQLGGLLQTQVRKWDTLARLGGDEFGVLLEHCSLEQARRVADALRQAVETFRFVWEGKGFRIGVSIGLVPITEASAGVIGVLRAADAACYAAKDEGRNRIHMYLEDDVELARPGSDMQWMAQIDQALQDDRLRLSYQPIVPVEACNSEGEHYELLLRMEDESGSIVPPGAFLPAAERYNLSNKLDRWVTATAFEWLSCHLDHLKRLYLCAINLSAASLGDDEFLKFVIQQFDETNIPPTKICFEITETTAIANLPSATHFIKPLNELGCRFALDDFGSGLSSFAYLKNLPVDFLKINAVFVRNVVDDPIDLAMVKAINEIGQAMGKKTIAESVENEAILEKLRLRDIGIDYAQGYGVGRPQPIEAML